MTSTTAQHQHQLSEEQADELQTLTTSLRGSLRQYEDFPKPGVLYEDILPIFASPVRHAALIRALEIHLTAAFPPTLTPPYAGIDVVVGLEARGFLFAPALALRLGAAFVPVRKAGKLPGECIRVGYKKEYGEDFFEMQKDGAIREGSRVVVVDDIIATGGSAAAAEQLVTRCGGTVVEFCFLMESDFFDQSKLHAPVFALLSGQTTEPES